MDFLHSREYLNGGDIVAVDCSHQCNIGVLNDSAFRLYKQGSSFIGHYLSYKKFPVKIKIVSTGYWNIVLDLGGGIANIQHSISFIKNS